MYQLWFAFRIVASANVGLVTGSVIPRPLANPCTSDVFPAPMAPLSRRIAPLGSFCASDSPSKWVVLRVSRDQACPVVFSSSEPEASASCRDSTHVCLSTTTMVARPPAELSLAPISSLPTLIRLILAARSSTLPRPKCLRVASRQVRR